MSNATTFFKVTSKILGILIIWQTTILKVILTQRFRVIKITFQGISLVNSQCPQTILHENNYIYIHNEYTKF